VTAAIAIHDAAKADFRRLGLTDHFIRSDLAREFFLRSDDPDPNYRDPLAVNRAYRDLRNLRVHHGKSLVLLRTRVLEADIAENPSVPLNGGEPRWFLKPLDAEDRRLLAKPHITGSERDRFHEWVDTRPLATVLCQHLVVLADAIKRTERTLERVSVQRQPRPKR
jgi:hypothetical protein